MKTSYRVSFLSSAVFLLAGALPGPLFCGNSYEAISAKLAQAAKSNKLVRLAVLDFSTKGGAGATEADYASERIGAALSCLPGAVLIERKALEKVLGEGLRAFAAGASGFTGKSMARMLSVDAVVTGTVFAEGRKLRILARLVESRTGQVLMAAEAEISRKREWMDMVADLPSPPIPKDWKTVDLLPKAGSFRDAPADGESCSARRRRLAKLNAELVDDKALYWASRMRSPGFSIAGLTRNPGSEIGDPSVKARFYRLLSEYYKAGSLPGAAPGRFARLAGLMKEEKSVADSCGLH